MMRRVCLVALLLTTCGCGGAETQGSLPETVPATGVVKLNGKPLPFASVMFIPQGATKGIECIGSTDESGMYSLKQIRGGDGAPPGEYKVVISRFLKPDGQPLSPGEPPANVMATESLPAVYSDVTVSRLTASIPATGGEFPFDLKSR